MRTAIVTGASRGLGLELARALAEREWRLVVDARSPSELEVVRAELAAIADVVAIVLMAIPGPPVFDAETAEQISQLMAKGVAGSIFLTTEDCQATYEELKARGVEFSEPPEERPYGIDSGFHDPSGNSIRLTQVRELAEV